MEILQELKSTFQYVDNPICIANDKKIIQFTNKAFTRIEEESIQFIGKNSAEIKNLYNYIVSPILKNKKIAYYLYIQKTDLNDNISKYENLFQHMPLPYQNLNECGTVLNINHAWSENFGYKKEDVIGRNFSEFITEDSQVKLLKKFSELLLKNKVDDTELNLIHKDKTIIPIRINGNITYDKFNKIEQAHCILQNISNEQKYKEQFLKSYEETIYSFIAINEQKDGYTAGHSQRVAYYSSKIAESMGMNEKTVHLVYKSGMLHDIGKIIIPESILLKPGSFNELELKIMKEHPQSGYDILEPISMYKEISNIIVHHHEHYDGSGYPFAKQGDDIPIISQILTIADTFDAMTTNRIYKVRKSVEQAIAELITLSGKWFEPILLQKSIKFLQTLPEIKQVNQLPKTDIEKQRFSYFFKDRLTDVYNGDYLNIHLQENNLTHKYECLNFIKIHNMSQYNLEYGWEEGNLLLKKFSQKLIDFTSIENIYRVYGDDFIIINAEHIEIDLSVVNSWDIIKGTCLSIEIKHYNLKNTDINSWQKLETNVQ